MSKHLQRAQKDISEALEQFHTSKKIGSLKIGVSSNDT
jgi:hypothetical protein